ncbi:MAG: presqualene diphosphate synthase HpnD [Rhodospirillales bacterium]
MQTEQYGNAMPLDDVQLGPNEDVLSIVKKSGTSFYWAMRLLPQEKRDAMFAIYAFCREVDDIADGDEKPSTKREKLDLWRDEINSLYDGKPNNFITRSLAKPLKTYNLAKEDFDAVIDGMEMDAVDQLSFQDMTELTLYCDRVACAVGKLSNAVFGLRGEQSRALAKSLGEALQLTNILRDVKEDAERNHVYLPADLRARHGMEGEAVNTIIKHPGLAEACRELALQAEKDFLEAKTIIDQCDKTLIQPAIIMMKIYHRTFILLQRRGWNRLDSPVKVSKAWKLLLAARILIFKA